MWTGGSILGFQTTRKDNIIFSIYATKFDDKTKIVVVGLLHHFIRIPEYPAKAVWRPGEVSTSHPHVIAASVEGQWIPEDGYTWIANPSITGDFSVKWMPGRKSTHFNHIVAAAEEGRWLPDDGYAWIIKPPVPGDFRVKWVPGAPSSKRQHLVAASAEEQWVPERGYTWASNPPSLTDFRVTPLPSPPNQLTPNQVFAGCTYDGGILNCPGPGTGMCWAKGHNPYLDQPPLSIDVGTDPRSPDFGHGERCSGG